MPTKGENATVKFYRKIKVWRPVRLRPRTVKGVKFTQTVKFAVKQTVLRSKSRTLAVIVIRVLVCGVCGPVTRASADVPINWALGGPENSKGAYHF